jgi:hypothetical protein
MERACCLMGRTVPKTSNVPVGTATLLENVPFLTTPSVALICNVRAVFAMTMATVPAPLEANVNLIVIVPVVPVPLMGRAQLRTGEIVPPTTNAVAVCAYLRASAL